MCLITIKVNFNQFFPDAPNSLKKMFCKIRLVTEIINNLMNYVKTLLIY